MDSDSTAFGILHSGLFHFCVIAVILSLVVICYVFFIFSVFVIALYNGS